ncbi:MAG: hypothetical protein ABUT20_17595 [Bacteroidota bacterium]
MKCSFFVSVFLLVACGSSDNDVTANLISEQKLLKDSANNLTESIGDYLRRGIVDSAEVQKAQVESLHARLINIQYTLDSITKAK